MTNVKIKTTDKNELTILNTPIEKHSIQEWQIKKGLLLEHRMFELLSYESEAIDDAAEQNNEKRFLAIAAALTRIIAGTQRGIAQLHRMDIDDAKTKTDATTPHIPIEETAQKIEGHIASI